MQRPTGGRPAGGSRAATGFAHLSSRHTCCGMHEICGVVAGSAVLGALYLSGSNEAWLMGLKSTEGRGSICTGEPRKMYEESLRAF